MADPVLTARPRPRSRSRPVLRIFSEARLQRQEDGTVEALDVSSGAIAWDRYPERLGSVELAARVGPADGTAGAPLGAVAVHPLPFYAGPGQLFRRWPSILAAALRATESPQLCLFWLPGTLGLAAGAWCRLRGRRYAVEVVGDPYDVLRSGVLGPVGWVLAAPAGWLMRWVVGGAAAGHYVTETTLQTSYPLAPAAAEHCYSNVRLGPEDFTSGPRPEPRPVRRLLAVGTHDQLYKGHDDLIRAVALLRDRGVDVQLDLVGDGRHHLELVELARRSGVGDRVTFHGRVNDRREVRRLLDQADLFCMPSRTEGLPRALIEAMARGVPSVGTDVGGIPELLDAAHCVRPDDPAGLADLVEAFVAGTEDAVQASAVAWSRAQWFRPGLQAARVDGWLDELAALAQADR